jgi:hypothetical protein
MNNNFLKDGGFNWLLVMLLLTALIIAVMIYYNKRINIINNKLKETSAVSVASKLPEGGLHSGK